LPSMISNSPISAGGSDTAPAGITAPSAAGPGSAASESEAASSPSASSSVPSSASSSVPSSAYSSDADSPSSEDPACSSCCSCSSASPVSSGASSLAAAGLEVASWPLPPSSPPQAASPRVARARADRNTTGLRVTMKDLSIQRQNALSYGILRVGAPLWRRVSAHLGALDQQQPDPGGSRPDHGDHTHPRGPAHGEEVHQELAEAVQEEEPRDDPQGEQCQDGTGGPQEDLTEAQEDGGDGGTEEQHSQDQQEGLHEGLPRGAGAGVEHVEEPDPQAEALGGGLDGLADRDQHGVGDGVAQEHQAHSGGELAAGQPQTQGQGEVLSHGGEAVADHGAELGEDRPVPLHAVIHLRPGLGALRADDHADRQDDHEGEGERDQGPAESQHPIDQVHLDDVAGAHLGSPLSGPQRRPGWC